MVPTVAEIKELLAHNDKAVEEAVLRIYERQTQDEQNSQSTVHSNGVGFSAFDAEILTSFAQWILRSTRAKGYRLTEKQMAVARRKISRYAKQLVEVAAEKAARVQEPVPAQGWQDHLDWAESAQGVQ